MTKLQPALAELTLLDWKRDVFALYARIRDLPPHEGWQMWRIERLRWAGASGHSTCRRILAAPWRNFTTTALARARL